MVHGMRHIVKMKNQFLKSNPFLFIKCHTSNNNWRRWFHLSYEQNKITFNIWNDVIVHNVNALLPPILVTCTSQFEQYKISFQSEYGLHKKSIAIEGEKFMA